MRAFLYIVSASSDPDHITCPVPSVIDENEIFFGPCKRRLRSDLRAELLASDRDDVTPDNALYLVGFNGTNRARTRKVVWAGRIKRAMTFARAWDELVGPRYQAMRDLPYGPLHLEPIRGDNGRLVGYRHATRLHAGKWIEDLTAKAEKKSGSYCVSNQGREICIANCATPWDAFERDACFLLENLFWARGSGIEVDTEIIDILRKAQPEQRNAIDSYAVFGRRKDGSADGKTGSWLTVEGGLARQLLAAITERARKLEPTQEPLRTRRAQLHCHPAGVCRPRPAREVAVRCASDHRGDAEPLPHHKNRC